ncbi:MAG: hypothetical protein RR427_11255, partial [Cellulosilyticaceae bacterium]
SMYTTNLFLKTYYTKEECLVRGLDYEKEVIERRSRCNKVLNKYWFNITARLHDTLNELIIEMEDVLNLSRDNQLILEADEYLEYDEKRVYLRFKKYD